MRRRRRRPELEARRVPRDPFLKLQRLKTRHPQIFEWRHRLRVFEEILRRSHPHNRDHMERYFASEYRAVQEDANTLLRHRELTGAATELDINLPPQNAVRFRADAHHRELLDEEPFETDRSLTETEEEEEGEDEEEQGVFQPPPRYCGPPSPRGDRGGGGPGSRGILG